MKILIVCFAIMLLCCGVLRAQEYDFYDLGTLGGETKAYAINDAGQVVGYSKIGSVPYAFLWEAGSMGNLAETIGAGYSAAYGISESGAVTGEASFNQQAPRAFYWDTSNVTDLQTLGGNRSVGYGVNNAGQVVGKSQAGAGSSAPYQPIYWDTGLSALQALQDANGRAQAINNAGQAAGSLETQSNDNAGFDRAFVWDSVGGVQILQPSESSVETFAQAINAQGSITGYSEAEGGQYQGFLWDSIGQVRYDLGPGSQGFGMNDASSVVGEFDTGSSGIHAFLHRGDGLTDLNSFLPEGSGWVLQSAQDINNAGSIVGWGQFNGQVRAYMLKPKVVPEPMSMLLFVVGGGAIAAARKLRRSK